MEANLWLVPLSLGQLGFYCSKQPRTLSHKYKKSLSPLGKVPHSSIGVFLSTPFMLQASASPLVFSIDVFKLHVWL